MRRHHLYMGIPNKHMETLAACHPVTGQEPLTSRASHLQRHLFQIFKRSVSVLDTIRYRLEPQTFSREENWEPNLIHDPLGEKDSVVWFEMAIMLVIHPYVICHKTVIQRYFPKVDGDDLGIINQHCIFLWFCWLFKIPMFRFLLPSASLIAQFTVK